MNKTKIEYVEHTWNPVTGCLHGCEYCYARRIANRFKGWTDSFGDTHYDVVWKTDKPVRELQKPLNIAPNEKLGKWPKAPFPFGFIPTLHKYRFVEPQQVKKPSKIFVCSMADLFGDWVPDEWIQEIFDTCFKADWHTYLFLTKNPSRYDTAIGYFCGEERGFEPEHWDNMWFGTTVTCQKDTFRISDLMNFLEGRKFISIEPLLGEISLTEIDLDGNTWVNTLTGDWKCYHPYGGLKKQKSHWQHLEWVIIGAETGNRKGKIVPKREWIDNIVSECKQYGIPVFMKNSLKEIMGSDFIQELPEQIKSKEV